MRVALLLDWQLYYTIELANALAADHEVMLITRDHTFEISSPDAPVTLDAFLDATLDKSILTCRIRFRRRDPRGIAEVFKIRKLIKSWGAEVVHIQDTTDWRILLLSILSRKRTTVLTVHDVQSHIGESRGWKQFLFMTLVASVKKVIVHGEFLKDQFRRQFVFIGQDKKVANIPHGAFTIFRKLSDPPIDVEENSVLFFGRISPYKGLEDLISAQPLVSQQVPGARFIIAGGGGDVWKYLERVEDMGPFEVHNRFIPGVEVANFFKRAAVVVLPYREASQSGVIPVAYSFGKPVIATRVGSLPEVVDDGRSGILVEPEAPGKLAEAIIRILKDGHLKKQLGDGARYLANTRLSWRSIARRTMEFYMET